MPNNTQVRAAMLAMLRQFGIVEEPRVVAEPTKLIPHRLMSPAPYLCSCDHQNWWEQHSIACFKTSLALEHAWFALVAIYMPHVNIHAAAYHAQMALEMTGKTPAAAMAILGLRQDMLAA